jgi:hypothetical protein
MKTMITIMTIKAAAPAPAAIGMTEAEDDFVAAEEPVQGIEQKANPETIKHTDGVSGRGTICDDFAPIGAGTAERALGAVSQRKGPRQAESAHTFLAVFTRTAHRA